MDLEALLDDIAVEAGACLAEHPEATISIAVSHQGMRGFRRLRSPDAQHVAVPNEGTLYEIASTSKVFMAAVLAVLDGRGVLGLDDPIVKHLPSGLQLSPAIGAITIRQLATHSSGLPDEGKAHLEIQESEHRGTEPPWGYYTQYLRYTKELLYSDVETAELAYPTGQGHSYSVLGMGVLGHILELATGRGYEELLRELVTGPLGLRDLAYSLDKEQLSRVVYGYDKQGQPCPNWYWDVMLPQGGLRGSVVDMLTFAEATIAAHREPDTSELATALRRATEIHFVAPPGVCLPGTEVPLPFVQGLAWMGFKTRDPHRFNWCHTGTTLFYDALIGASPESGIGFAALYSSGTGIADAAEIHGLTMKWFFTAVESALQGAAP